MTKPIAPILSVLTKLKTPNLRPFTQALGIFIAICSHFFYVPVHAQTPLFCSSVFSGARTLSELDTQIETLFRSGPVRDHGALKTLLQGHVDALHTPEEFVQFFRLIEKHEGTIYHRTFANRKLTEWQTLLPTLSQINIAQRLLFVRASFTTSQVRSLQDSLKAAARKHENYFVRTSWEDFSSAFQMIFEPAQVFRYISNLSKEKSLTQTWAQTPHHAASFNENHIFALLALPKHVAQKAHAELLRLYRHAKLTPYDDVNNPKTLRRNYELLIRTLNEDSLQRLLGNLKGRNQMRVNEIGPLIETFWINLGYRSQVALSDVIRAARTIQRSSISKYLKEDYVELYGSFPNGKFDSSSDIDLHLGPELMKVFYRAFTERGTYASPHVRFRDETPEIAYRLSEDFQNTERELARGLGRDQFKPAKFMTVVSHLPGSPEVDFFRPQMIAVYNPLIVRLTPDTITLRIYDGFKTKKVYEIEIIEDSL